MKLSVASVLVGGVAVVAGVVLVAGVGVGLVVGGVGLLGFGFLRESGDQS